MTSPAASPVASKRLLLCSAVGLAAMVAVAVAAGALPGAARSQPHRFAPSPALAAEPTVAVDVLRSWDRRRARAYADGNVRALRALYVPGSRAGTADVRLLRDYLRRGLRVERLTMQLLAVHTLCSRAGVLRLRVTDRVHRAVAVSQHSRRLLPRDHATTRLMTLRRPEGHGPWRVAAVLPRADDRVAACRGLSRSALRRSGR